MHRFLDVVAIHPQTWTSRQSITRLTERQNHSHLQQIWINDESNKLREPGVDCSRISLLMCLDYWTLVNSYISYVQNLHFTRTDPHESLHKLQK